MLTQGRHAVLTLLDGSSTLCDLLGRCKTIPTFADDVRLLFDQGCIADASPAQEQGPAEDGGSGAESHLQPRRGRPLAATAC